MPDTWMTLFFSRKRAGIYARQSSDCMNFFDLGGFETHPDKTQLGKIEYGFDWLGIWYAPEGPRIAPRAIENHRAHIARLYEQARMRKLSKAETDLRVREYETRWMS